MTLDAVAGERFGVERVALAERAEGADEGLDLAGIGAMGRAAGCQQRREQGVLVAAGGLADGQAVRPQPCCEGRQSL